MKLVGSGSSRAILLFSIEEVRPIGGLHWQEFRDALVDRYSLTEAASESTSNSEQAAFRDGKLVNADGGIAFEEITINKGGLAISAHTAEDSMKVLRDLIEWVKARFRFRNLDNLKDPYFISSIIVEFDEDIEKHVSVFAKLATLFGDEMTEQDGLKLPIGLRRLSFSRDPLEIPGNTSPGEFIIERREGVSFGERRYFCQGPTKTDQLIRLMEKLEKIIASK